jgi:hypothetical protein
VELTVEPKQAMTSPDETPIMAEAVEDPDTPTQKNEDHHQREAPTENAGNEPKKSSVAIPILPIEVSLLRFLVILIFGWIIFYAMMSANARWTVETYIPWSFWLLHYLLMFGIVGGGWPLVAPFGEYGKPFWGGHGRLGLGIIMTGLTVGVAVALSTFFVNVWWGYPLFPGGAWFGIGLFYMTLWWILDVQTTPTPLIPDQQFCLP